MAEPSRTRWGLVLVATGAGVIAAAHVGKVPAALPAIRAEFGLDLVSAGWVVSIFNATGMAGGMLAGVFADRIGHRRLALTGLAALLLGSLAGATAESGTVLLLTRFLEGLGFVTTAVSAPSIIANAAKHRDRRLALGLWGAYMPAGVAAMMLMSPALLAPFGWRGLWLAVAAATGVWFAVLWTAGRPAAHSLPPSRSPLRRAKEGRATGRTTSGGGRSPGRWIHPPPAPPQAPPPTPRTRRAPARRQPWSRAPPHRGRPGAPGAPATWRSPRWRPPRWRGRSRSCRWWHS